MPKTGKKQDAVLMIRLYKAEREQIQIAAKSAHRALSAFVRETLLRECERLISPQQNTSVLQESTSQPVPKKKKEVGERKSSSRIRSNCVKNDTVGDASPDNIKELKELRSSTSKEKLAETDSLEEVILRTVSRKTGHELDCPCFQCLSLVMLMRPKSQNETKKRKK